MVLTSMEPMGNFTTSRTDKLVLEVIGEFLKERPMVSATEIAEVMGCERKTVVRATGRLVERGQLKILSEKGKPNRYEITA